MAAVAAGLAIDGDSPTGIALDSLVRFRGVRRRQEVLASVKGLTVVEDFGHHPTAISEDPEIVPLEISRIVAHGSF